MISRRAVVLGGMASVLAGCTVGGYRGPERSLAIAAGEHGGLYLAFATLLASELNRAEPRLHCRAVSTEGSVDNLSRVHRGDVDIGLTLADVAEAAVAGEAPYRAPVPLRALGRVYENYLQMIVRADGSVRDLADLAGRPVSLGAPRSGASVEGDRLLAASGVRMKTGHYLLADALDALRERRLAAALWSGGIPTPAVAKLSNRTTISLLALDGVLPALRARYGPVYVLAQVPPNAYRGVGGLPAIGVANLLVVSPSLPDDVAAAVVRVLVTRAAHLVPAQAVGTQFLDVRTLIGTGTVPLHPGAVTAYRSFHG